MSRIQKTTAGDRIKFAVDTDASPIMKWDEIIAIETLSSIRGTLRTIIYRTRQGYRVVAEDVISMMSKSEHDEIEAWHADRIERQANGTW